MKPFDPWKDSDCISSFVELNLEDFQEWAWEKSIPKDQWPDKELAFCEYRKKQFVEFGNRYKEGLVEEEADRSNDELKAHQDE